MDRRTATIGLLAVLALLAGITWWVVAGEDEPAPGGGGPHTEGTEASRPPVPPSGDGPEPPSHGAVAAVRVHVEAVLLRPFAAPADATYPAVAAWSRDAAPLPAMVIAGTLTPLLEPDLRPGRALVRVAMPDGERELARVVTVAEPAAPAPLAVGVDVAVRGRVRSANGAPVAGARVWAGELRGGAVAGEVETDAEGAFETVTAGGDGAPITVRAEGFAWQWRPVTAANGVEIDFTLQPECVLDVRLSAVAVGLEAARVFALPVEAATELQRFPFFLASLEGGSPANAEGRALVRGLPRGAEVQVVAVHPLSGPQPGPKSRRLAGASVVATVPVPFLPEVRGRAVDGEGKPLAGALVVCRTEERTPRPGDAARLLLPPWVDAWGVCVATTAADGTFAVGARAGAPHVLSVRAPGHAGSDVALPAVRGAANGGDTAPRDVGDVVCPAWRGAAVELRVPAPSGDLPWEARLGAGEWTAGEAGKAIALPLPRAGVYDVTVRVERGGAIGPPRSFAAIAAAGTAELPADAVR